MFYGLKKKIVLKSINKRKTASPFDINYGDNFTLGINDGPEVNNSHYLMVQGFKEKEVLFYRSAKRGGNGVDEVWLVYRNKRGEVFMAEQDHFTKAEKNPTRVECLRAGDELKFYYDGYVRQATLGERGYAITGQEPRLACKLVATFKATSRVFEFTGDMDSEVMASAIAKEKLNREFQNAFNEIYQVHYEQGGTATYTIEIDGKKDVINNFPAIRDHSYGKRQWDFFDRYVWSIIMLENGEFIHSSFMRYPVLKELQAGFILKGDHLVSIKEATPMDKLPIVGNSPKEFEFDVTYANGEKRHIKAKLDFVTPFYFENEFNVNEGVYEFNVDGIKGKGIGEFSFNKDKSRWVR